MLKIILGFLATTAALWIVSFIFTGSYLALVFAVASGLVYVVTCRTIRQSFDYFGVDGG